MAIKNREIVGVLLAGGQSRRMGGGDKGFLRLNGTTMVAHVIDQLRPQVTAMAINANGPAERFSNFGLPVIADTIEGHVGPLAGILAGMKWAEAAEREARYVATVSTDAPFLPDNLVLRLAEGLEGKSGVALAASETHVHPVIGLWPVDLANDLEAALRDGVRKVLHWTDRHGTHKVGFPLRRIGDRMVDPFFNANTPEELEEARALYKLVEK